MRALLLMTAILGAAVGNAVTFACLSFTEEHADRVAIVDEQIALEDDSVSTLGEETVELGFTFDGYGRDDELMIFDEEAEEPLPGKDFASAASWEPELRGGADFSMLATW